jgi:uncharacterized membrane protein YeaQ/YmgE (transglycosylase-associated protein family)
LRSTKGGKAVANATIIVLIAIWVVIGLLMSVLAGSIWKTERPYGEMADYIVSIVLTILTGFADWFLVPVLIHAEGALLFAIAVIEPACVALIGLWALRLVKQRSGGN